MLFRWVNQAGQPDGGCSGAGQIDERLLQGGGSRLFVGKKGLGRLSEYLISLPADQVTDRRCRPSQVGNDYLSRSRVVNFFS